MFKYSWCLGSKLKPGGDDLVQKLGTTLSIIPWLGHYKGDSLSYLFISKERAADNITSNCIVNLKGKATNIEKSLFCQKCEQEDVIQTLWY